MPKCKKCGGSGDMFIVEKGKTQVIVAFSEIKNYKKEGYTSTGNTICCSVCNGIGTEDIP